MKGWLQEASSSNVRKWHYIILKNEVLEDHDTYGFKNNILTMHPWLEKEFKIIIKERANQLARRSILKDSFLEVDHLTLDWPVRSSLWLLQAKIICLLLFITQSFPE